MTECCTVDFLYSKELAVLESPEDSKVTRPAAPTGTPETAELPYSADPVCSTDNPDPPDTPKTSETAETTDTASPADLTNPPDTADWPEIPDATDTAL